MRVLVTGATGQVGRAAAAWVTALGGEARRAVTRPVGADDVRFDFLDRATWAPALTGVEALFLLRPPALADMDRTLVPFVEAARRSGVAHCVFLSVLGADRMRWVPHAAVETALQRWPGGWTILRPGFFAQNLASQYARDIVEDHRLYLPAGEGRVAWVDTRDLGEVAARLCLGRPPTTGATWALTGSVASSMADTAEVLSRVLGRRVTYEAASAASYAWHLMARRRLPLLQVAIQTVLHVGLRRGDAEVVDPGMGQLLGRPPRSLEAYVRDHAAAFAA